MYGPQIQRLMVPPGVGAATAVALVEGVIEICLLKAPLRSAAAVVVIMITPVLVVATDWTYFVAALDALPCSQPQLLAAGKEAPVALCTVSVMLVRHAEPARIASETFARMV
ncbi:hypothetical protein D3C87_1238810 [compost metagenome]